MLLLLALLACHRAPGPDSGDAPDDTDSGGDTDSDTGDTDSDTGDTDSDTGDTDDSGTTDLPCRTAHASVAEVAQWFQDGPPDTTDGLSGGQAILARRNGVDWDLVVHGQAALVPDYDTDGAVAVWTNLGPPDTWLYAPPAVGELELVAVGDIDGDLGDDVIVAIEHAGLVGASAMVHSGEFETRSVSEGETVFSSDGTGSSPTVATGDLTGDGKDDLVVGFAEGVMPWHGPIPTGNLGAADGVVYEGRTHLWTTIGDVDDDGYADLLSATKAGGVVVLLGSAGGITTGPEAPDVILNLVGQPGAAVAGIVVGDIGGDGDPDIAITTLAITATNPAAWVYDGLDDGDPRSVSGGETGRYSAAMADLDGDGGDELVLGRSRYSLATGGLLVFWDLDRSPVRIDAESSDGLLGAAFGRGRDVDGDGRHELPAVDPWGAGEWRPRGYVLDLCL